jgi:hypothetical protein
MDSPKVSIWRLGGTSVNVNPSSSYRDLTVKHEPELHMSRWQVSTLVSRLVSRRQTHQLHGLELHDERPPY